MPKLLFSVINNQNIFVVLNQLNPKEKKDENIN
jgi:hypothetical protein